MNRMAYLVLFIGALISAVALEVALLRTYGPFSGWRECCQCKRCGFINGHSDVQVWGSDKTCKKCGPGATWKRIHARPVGLFGFETKEDDKTLGPRI